MNYCSFDFDLFNDPEKLSGFREHMRKIGEKHAEQRVECFKQKFSNQASIILDELNSDYRKLLGSWTIDKTELNKVYVELEQLYMQQRIDEIMEYSVSSAKLILRIFDAYLAKTPQAEISSFKDKFALIVVNMEFFSKGDLIKQSEIHKGFGELLGCVEPFYKDPFIDFGVSVIFDLMRLVVPVVDYLKTIGEKKPYDGTAYFYFKVNENYMSYVTRFGWLCQEWNKLKKERKHELL